jgi:DNA adenine methylase
MKYMGSKRRIAKEILPIILKDRKEGQWYVEPFCGGCNTIDKVTGNRLASDIHIPLISMFKALQEGWIPPESVSEEEYRQAKLLEDINPLKGFTLFCCSFAGKWKGGYAREVGSNKSTFATRGRNNLLAQLPSLLGVDYISDNYGGINYPPNSLIYCDPPYKGTTKYKDNLDYEHFYQWCRDMKAEGHTIFISEYAMPDDFTCVWEKPQTTNLANRQASLKAVERLFTLTN